MRKSSDPVPPADRPRAETVLLRALDIALDRRATVPQLLGLVKRAGWALVPRRIEENDGEVDDLVRVAALNAAYQHDDPLRAVYAAVIEYSDQALTDRFAVLHRLEAVTPEEREVLAG